VSEPNYPRFLRDLLDSCPEAGAGVHPWLFRVARYLHRYHSPEEICDILAARVTDCGRQIEPHEIPDAVKNSAPCKWEPSGNTPSERRAEWLKNPTHKIVPEFDPDLATRIAAEVPIDITPDWLKARSKIPVTCSTREYLESIYQPYEKAIIFNVYKSQGCVWPGKMSIDHWSSVHWPDGAWFLCNPVDGLSHFNPRLGRNSQRSKESVTSFRYGVLECDQKPREKWRPIWLRILAGLALPIVSITDSGGSSDHALVRGDCESKEAWDKWKREVLRPLVPLGADDGALSAVRLTRLPNCFRGDRKQELLYLNPAADGTPIFYQLKGL
jgi:hypothetical protein